MEKQAQSKRLDNMDNTINMREIINMQKTFANATIQRTDVHKPETPLPISKKSKGNKLKTVESSELPIQVFNNENLGSVRVVMQDDIPWFVASDICTVLEIRNTTQATSRLDDDEKSMLNIGLPGGATNCVNEYGLYSLVMASRKPEAKQFKRWINHDVLPSIRKHGVYVTPEKLVEFLATPESMIQIFTALHNEQQARIKAETKLNEAQPKITFANAVSQSDDSIQMGVFVKFLKQNGIDIGRTRLFKWLRDNDYLCSFGEVKNYPTQYSMENKWFTVKESYYVDKSNELKLGFTTLVTPKGQQYFINKFLNEAYA